MGIMELIISSADIAGGVFMAVILLEISQKQISGRTPGGKLYILFAESITIGLFIDAFSYILEGRGFNSVLLGIITALSFIIMEVCMAIYAFYVIALIRKKKEVSYLPAKIVAAAIGLNFCWLALGMYNGKLFRIVDGVCNYGPWRDYAAVIPMGCLVMLSFVMVFNIKALGRRNAVALATFMVFPMIAAGITLINSSCDFSFVAGGIASEIIYLFIQNEEIAETQLHEQLLSRITTTDELTGLKNRRGYDEAIDAIGRNDSLGVVFCDLNELKYINDHFGHAAGDAYIARFANLLRNSFMDDSEICRISGDEFVVLLPGAAPEDLERQAANLDYLIRSNNRIAAMGTAHGVGVPPLELVRLAEEEMYRDKSQYYKETGKDRRGRSRG